MKPAAFRPFRPLQAANALAQCKNCKTVSTFDTLDVIIKTDINCPKCDRPLSLYWNHKPRQIGDIRD